MDTESDSHVADAADFVAFPKERGSHETDQHQRPCRGFGDRRNTDVVDEKLTEIVSEGQAQNGR